MVRGFTLPQNWLNGIEARQLRGEGQLQKIEGYHKNPDKIYLPGLNSRVKFTIL